MAGKGGILSKTLFYFFMDRQMGENWNFKKDVAFIFSDLQMFTYSCTTFS